MRDNNVKSQDEQKKPKKILRKTKIKSWYIYKDKKYI